MIQFVGKGVEENVRERNRRKDVESGEKFVEGSGELCEAGRGEDRLVRVRSRIKTRLHFVPY